MVLTFKVGHYCKRFMCIYACTLQNPMRSVLVLLQFGLEKYILEWLSNLPKVTQPHLAERDFKFRSMQYKIYAFNLLPIFITLASHHKKGSHKERAPAHFLPFFVCILSSSFLWLSCPVVLRPAASFGNANSQPASQSN